jgi:hypothetical protein
LRLPQICLVTGLLFAAGGCADWERMHASKGAESKVTVEKPQTIVTPPPSQPPPVKPRRQVRETPREPQKEPERVASIDPKSLIGLAPSAVEKMLGAPTNISKGDPSLVWTYSGQGCSFQIFFYPDLKTASFHALKYSSSGGAGESDACIRNILAVRTNGPG